MKNALFASITTIFIGAICAGVSGYFGIDLDRTVLFMLLYHAILANLDKRTTGRR